MHISFFSYLQFLVQLLVQAPVLLEQFLHVLTSFEASTLPFFAEFFLVVLRPNFEFFPNILTSYMQVSLAKDIMSKSCDYIHYLKNKL